MEILISSVFIELKLQTKSLLLYPAMYNYKLSNEMDIHIIFALHNSTIGCAPSILGLYIRRNMEGQKIA